jgi:hypothetical protein
MSHTSSFSFLRFELLNGQTSPDPHVAASLRIGGNGGEPALAPAPEFSIAGAHKRARHGRLTWDADHQLGGPRSRFFSVAAVKLDVRADGQCLLSVGTSPFVRFMGAPYQWIDKVQVAAAAGTLTPQRWIQWDWIQLDLLHADGHCETRQSACLPKIATGSGIRRALQAPPAGSSHDARVSVAQQFAELSTGTRDVIGLKVRGQVTMRANDAAEAASPLGREDLLGSVLVFTDASLAAAPRGRRQPKARIVAGRSGAR